LEHDDTPGARLNKLDALLAQTSTPIYGWFTEAFDTLDLKEAKVLLDGPAS
jgi:hypothetical protein